MKPRIVSAIVRRELMSYFASPTGYVFITIFIFLSAFAAFWLEGFFARNLANLDQLNIWFPALLLLIVPAITMGAWADERKQGTEELLLTLPARDWELVVGKYLACLLIYTVALIFSMSHVLVLSYLGEPDLGLMASTYLGYWLSGAGLLAVGLVASALTSNLTISFILAAMFCAAIVGAGQFELIFPGTLVASASASISLPNRFEEFGKGVVSMQNIGYFALLAIIGLWLNTVLISRRHWGGSSGAGGRMALLLARGAAFLVIAAASVTLLGRTPLRADATAEGLWSLSGESRKLVAQIDPDQPVFIRAYISPAVPSSYVQTRETLLGLLRELDAVSGGGRIEVEVIDTEPFTEAAREASESYNITPVSVMTGPDDPQQGVREVFLGLAFTRGAEQFVLPFVSAGLPVEYELARSIRSVSIESRKRIGVLDNDLAIAGAFDYQTYTSRPPWPIVDELRKQYDVVMVARGEAVRDDLDVLLVAQPSLLNDADLAPIVDYIADGHPALVIEDPLPLVNPGLGTSFDRNENMNPFQRQQAPPAEPKANLAPLWALLGVRVDGTSVLWDSHNPHPQQDMPREIIFVTRNSGAAEPFNPREATTSNLQEVVFMAPGELIITGTGERTTGLLYTSRNSGRTAAGEVFQRTFFGMAGFNPNRRHEVTLESHPLAVYVRGIKDEDPVNAIVLSDLDFMSPEFFRLRAQGGSGFNFDNVTLILNFVDVLAGDESLLELRKRRPAYRTLSRIDAARLNLDSVKESQVQAAKTTAKNELTKAKASFDGKVAEIEKREDLDETTRRIMIQSTQQTEQRRYEVQQAAIERIKQEEIRSAEADTRQQINALQTVIRLEAVLLPPIPALALAGIVFLRRRSQELEGVARERLR